MDRKGPFREGPREVICVDQVDLLFLLLLFSPFEKKKKEGGKEGVEGKKEGHGKQKGKRKEKGRSLLLPPRQKKEKGTMSRIVSCRAPLSSPLLSPLCGCRPSRLGALPLPLGISHDLLFIPLSERGGASLVGAPRVRLMSPITDRC
jgi:hypothetical protein